MSMVVVVSPSVKLLPLSRIVVTVVVAVASTPWLSSVEMFVSRRAEIGLVAVTQR